MIETEGYLSVFQNIDRGIMALLRARAELEQLLEEKGIILEIPEWPDPSEFEDPLFQDM